MALATSNRAQVRYLAEVSFGADIVGTEGQDIRITGESLTYSKTTDSSKELRSDRQVQDLIVTGASASGGINFELSYGEYDELMAAVLTTTEVAYGAGALATSTLSGTVEFSLGNSLQASGATIAPYVAGQWIVISGCTGAAAVNNGPYKVVSVTGAVDGNDLVVAGTNPFTNVVSATGTITITPAQAYMTNTASTANFSYTIERALLDATSELYYVFKGMVPSKMSLSAASGGIVGGSFDFMGKNMDEGLAKVFITAVPSLDYPVVNAVSGAGKVSINHVPQNATFVKSMKFDIDNKLRSRDAIGMLGAASIGYGTFEVKGDMEIYLQDNVLYQMFLDNDDIALAYTVLDDDGNGYIFEFPKVNFTDAKTNAGGLDADMMLALPFTALAAIPTTPIAAITDPKTLIIHRVGAAL